MQGVGRGQFEASFARQLNRQRAGRRRKREGLRPASDEIIEIRDAKRGRVRSQAASSHTPCDERIELGPDKIADRQ